MAQPSIHPAIVGFEILCQLSDGAVVGGRRIRPSVQPALEGNIFGLQQLKLAERNRDCASSILTGFDWRKRTSSMTMSNGVRRRGCKEGGYGVEPGNECELEQHRKESVNAKPAQTVENVRIRNPVMLKSATILP